MEIKVEAESGLDSMTIEDLKRATNRAVPLAVHHQDGTLLADPHDDLRLAAGGTLIVVGRLRELAKLRTDLE